MSDKPSQPASTTHSKEGPAKIQYATTGVTRSNFEVYTSLTHRFTLTGTCTEHGRCTSSVPPSIIQLFPSNSSTTAALLSSLSPSSNIPSSSPQEHTSFTSTSRESSTIPKSTSSTTSATNAIAYTSTQWSSVTWSSTTSSLQVSISDPSSSEVSPGPTDSPSGRFGRQSETPIIVGAALGGSVLVVLLFALFCVRQRRKRNRQSFISKFEREKCEPSMIWLDNIQQDISNLRSDTAASAAVRRSLSSHSSYSADCPHLPTPAAHSGGTERGITYDPEDDEYDRLTSEDMNHVHRRPAFEAVLDGNRGVYEAM